MSDTKTPDKAIMNKVYKEYGLTPDHVFAHKHYKIITRAGIDKIQAAANIKVDYEVVKLQFADVPYQVQRKTRDGLYDAQFVNKGDIISVVLKVTGRKLAADGSIISEITSFSEASPSNCDNTYYMAIAEKRGMARVVLKLSGLYAEDHFSEDEADDFKKTVMAARRGAKVVGE